MQTSSKVHYLGNINLRAVNYNYPYTLFEIKEYIKCKNDPIYFIKNYIKIIHPDRGLELMQLYPYQEDMIRAYHKDLNVISLTGRQMGKSTTFAAFLCWYVIFNDSKYAIMLANKMSTAREIFSKFQMAYENLPKFLQQGVKEWNKTSVELENGSKARCAATSASAVRGHSPQLLYLDEYAHVANNTAEDFFTSVFPTLSAGKTNKLIITSTPKGYNHYYKIWNDAILGKNGYTHIHVTWDAHPERDEAWRIKELAMLGDENFAQEHLTEFLGSSNTLIKGQYIKSMSIDTPLYSKDGLTIYKHGIPEGQYIRRPASLPALIPTLLFSALSGQLALPKSKQSALLITSFILVYDPQLFKT